LTVLNWNTEAIKARAALALELNREYDVIALIEPWLNAETGQPYYRCGS
jgi:hypothetical protein